MELALLIGEIIICILDLAILYMAWKVTSQTRPLDPKGAPVFFKRPRQKVKPKVQDDEKAWQDEQSEVDAAG